MNVRGDLWWHQRGGNESAQEEDKEETEKERKEGSFGISLCIFKALLHTAEKCIKLTLFAPLIVRPRDTDFSSRHLVRALSVSIPRFPDFPFPSFLNFPWVVHANLKWHCSVDLGVDPCIYLFHRQIGGWRNLRTCTSLPPKCSLPKGCDLWYGFKSDHVSAVPV